jgi:hypothetical protein
MIVERKPDSGGRAPGKGRRTPVNGRSLPSDDFIVRWTSGMVELGIRDRPASRNQITGGHHESKVGHYCHRCTWSHGKSSKCTTPDDRANTCPAPAACFAADASIPVINGDLPIILARVSIVSKSGSRSLPSFLLLWGHDVLPRRKSENSETSEALSTLRNVPFLPDAK